MALTKQQKNLIWEFIRYVFVGGIASVVDLGVNSLVRELCFSDSEAWLAMCTGVTVGFVAGICVNYILSMALVFRTDKQQKQGRNKRAVLIFVIVGIVGYGLRLLLQWLGEDVILRSVMGEELGIWKYAVTVAVMGIVLIWNYVGRKILVFGGMKDEQ